MKKKLKRVGVPILKEDIKELKKKNSKKLYFLNSSHTSGVKIEERLGFGSIGDPGSHI